MKNNVELLNSKDFEVLDELLKIKDEPSFEFVNEGYSFCNRPAFINSIYYINNYEKEVQEKLKTFCSYIKTYKYVGIIYFISIFIYK